MTKSSKRKEQEDIRLHLAEKILAAINKLREEVNFEEAYLFGFVTRPFRFSERSDIDIGFIELDNRDLLRITDWRTRSRKRESDGEGKS